MADDPLISSLRAAVQAAPDDAVLRLHLASQLAARGLRDEAVREAASVLARDPANGEALAIIAGTADGARPAPADSASPALAPSPPSAPVHVNPPSAFPRSGAPAVPAPPEGADTKDGSAEADDDEAHSDADVLRHLEEDLAGTLEPMFVNEADGQTEEPAFEIERSRLRLADVGGMHEVKQRLEASLLAPMRNPELGRLYGKAVRGGLLLYGPPGCGKTFIARAVAGEMGANFIAVSLSDVLDMYIGASEHNLHEIFETARANTPCVVFLDELDALGLKRTQQINTGGRRTVNQLLTELDGVSQDNEGVFVLGATNHPWDIDTALRRPGRFDRMLLVLPPDEPAREAILRYHLRDRPIASIDTGKIARLTDGYSGADLRLLCDAATERAMLDSVASGTVRMVTMADLQAAVRDVRPSVGPWLETARNVVEFGNADGTYDELGAYLRKRKIR